MTIPPQVRDLVYLLAAVLFILDLKWMAHPRTAVRGNAVGALGMALAIAVTLASEPLEWPLLLGAAAVGALVGAVTAMRVQMTAMPEMVAIFNGFGGGASILVAGAALVAAMNALAGGGTPGLQMRIATVVSAVIGSITFFGSYVAFGKLAEFLAVKWKLYPWQRAIKYGYSLAVVLIGVGFAVRYALTGHPVGSAPWLAGAGTLVSSVLIGGVLLRKRDRFPGMDVLKIATLLASVATGFLVVTRPDDMLLFTFLVAVSGLLGVLLTLSIGGADMPVVIALLNSYSGLAAAATGFVIDNTVLIISGSLVGASGVILTNIMCKAMNRSLTNVLFGALGPSAEGPQADEVYKTVKATSADEIAMMLDGVQRVAVVPGYGMAVAQAQHAVKNLASTLEAAGIRVEYAIHPVAGRMPGHMNVLLAEADVPYDKLREMDDINAEMDQIDVCIVLGANDVVNPSARTDPTSPIAGMPIIDADRARTVVVIKRSLSPGFAGIPNPLFALDNTLMFFADGKQAVNDILNAVKEAA